MENNAKFYVLLRRTAQYLHVLIALISKALFQFISSLPSSAHRITTTWIEHSEHGARSGRKKHSWNLKGADGTERTSFQFILQTHGHFSIEGLMRECMCVCVAVVQSIECWNSAAFRLRFHFFLFCSCATIRLHVLHLSRITISFTRCRNEMERILCGKLAIRTHKLRDLCAGAEISVSFSGVSMSNGGRFVARFSSAFAEV